MAPAFSSAKQAAGFALLLLVVLLLPALAGKHLLPPREEIYSTIPWRYGPFAHIRHQIFEEKADIDILFIGSSRLWAGIDTPYVQQELSKQLGRPAVVETLAWSWKGFDADYFIAQDLLQHRKVRMMVFIDETREEATPHPASRYWFRFGDGEEALRGLPLRAQSLYYFASILEMPQNLAELVRTNYPDELIAPEKDHWKTFFHATNSAERMGALTVETNSVPNDPFIRFTPAGDVQMSDVSIYAPETKARFDFSGTPAPEWQLHFARKFAELARTNGVKLVALNLCPEYSGGATHTDLIQEGEFWPETLQTDVAMVGIPPGRLYSGLSDRDRDHLFYMLRHYNQNGQQFYTKLVTPSLLQLYEDQTHR